MKRNQQKERPYFILTNDDGIHSPGLHALAEAVQPFADIDIVAPSLQMTATGRGLFGDRSKPLETLSLIINGQNQEAYHAPCSPAQVVMLGLQIFSEKRQPDLVISGINYGENMGRDVSMSGTVGAAIQAACMGIPALAVSMQTPLDQHYTHGEMNWDTASHFAAKFARMLLERTLPSDVNLLKIDVPLSASKKTPWKVTSLARQSYFQARISSPTMQSRLSDAEVTAFADLDQLDENSDIHTFLVKHLVSVTPISLDFTSRTDLGKLQEYLKNGD